MKEYNIRDTVFFFTKHNLKKGRLVQGEIIKKVKTEEKYRTDFSLYTVEYNIPDEYLYNLIIVDLWESELFESKEEFLNQL